MKKKINKSIDQGKWAVRMKCGPSLETQLNVAKPYNGLCGEGVWLGNPVGIPRDSLQTQAPQVQGLSSASSQLPQGLAL